MGCKSGGAQGAIAEKPNRLTTAKTCDSSKGKFGPNPAKEIKMMGTEM